VLQCQSKAKRKAHENSCLSLGCHWIIAQRHGHLSVQFPVVQYPSMNTRPCMSRRKILRAWDVIAWRQRHDGRCMCLLRVTRWILCMSSELLLVYELLAELFAFVLVCPVISLWFNILFCIYDRIFRCSRWLAVDKNDGMVGLVISSDTETRQRNMIQ
jgi:hypothetical protein